jgi:hypothetical protein
LQNDVTYSSRFFLHSDNFPIRNIQENLKMYFGEDKTYGTTEQYDCNAKMIKRRVRYSSKNRTAEKYTTHNQCRQEREYNSGYLRINISSASASYVLPNQRFYP